MILKRLAEPGVQRLHQIFSPPGLPIVPKAPGVSPTTSMAVRGGAGVGKTTLALALALAVARENEGTVLHLTTELDPVEVHLKARLLGLPEGSVKRWDEPASPSTLVRATHLELQAGAEEPQTPSERKLGALQAVWDLLHPEGQPGPPRDEKPVRAIVIDAFSAPQPEESQDALRRDLVALVQSLEGEGISVVLVEETLGDAPSWVPFVVDIVFELSWSASADTGDLARKLRCTKSRHAVARPGPHDYGVEGTTSLALWPDILMAASPQMKLRVAEPLRMAHMLDESRCVFFFDGGVLLAPTDGAGWRVETALRHTPGSRIIDVHCGAVTTIVDRTSGHELRWTEDRGISALGWMVAELLLERANAVILREPQLLLRRSPLAPGLLHLVETLRAMGGLVVLTGAEADLRGFSGLAGSPNAGPMNASRAPELREEPYRTSLWRAGLVALLRLLHAEPRLSTHTPREKTEGQSVSALRALLADVEKDATWQAPVEHKGLLQNVSPSNALPAKLLDLSYLLQWAWGWPAGPLSGKTPTGALVNLVLGQRRAAYGQLYEAGRLTSSSSPVAALGWAVFAATQAGNRAATRHLRQALLPGGSSAVPLGYVVQNELLRALAIWEGEEAMRLGIETICEYMDGKLDHEILRLEARLMGGEAAFEAPLSGAALLHRLAAQAAPRTVQADALYNIGLTAERFDSRREATDAYRAALARNPLLAIAQQRLDRLASTPPDL